MFLSRNKKNIDTFWLKKAPYRELWRSKVPDRKEYQENMFLISPRNKCCGYSPKWNEPAHDKTYRYTYANSEYSDQPAHLPSLIRVFAVCMKKAWVLSYPLSTPWRLIRLGICPGCSESSLVARHTFSHALAQIRKISTIFGWKKSTLSGAKLRSKKKCLPGYPPIWRCEIISSP